jgi:hypothetical protein
MNVQGKVASRVPARTRQADRKRSIHGLFDEFFEIGRHTIAFLAAIVSIWCIHLVLELLLGKDAQFFDRIPVRYVIDAGHLAVLVRFVWKLVQQIWSKP